MTESLEREMTESLEREMTGSLEREMTESLEREMTHYREKCEYSEGQSARSKKPMDFCGLPVFAPRVAVLRGPCACAIPICCANSPSRKKVDSW